MMASVKAVKVRGASAVQAKAVSEVNVAGAVAVVVVADAVVAARGAVRHAPRPALMGASARPYRAMQLPHLSRRASAVHAKNVAIGLPGKDANRASHAHRVRHAALARSVHRAKPVRVRINCRLRIKTVAERPHEPRAAQKAVRIRSVVAVVNAAVAIAVSVVSVVRRANSMRYPLKTGLAS